MLADSSHTNQALMHSAHNKDSILKAWKTQKPPIFLQIIQWTSEAEHTQSMKSKFATDPAHKIKYKSKTQNTVVISIEIYNGDEIEQLLQQTNARIGSWNIN